LSVSVRTDAHTKTMIAMRAWLAWRY